MESATVSSRDLIYAPTIAAQFFEGWNSGGGSFGSLGFAITGSNHIGFYGSSSSGVLAVTLLGSYDWASITTRLVTPTDARSARPTVPQRDTT